MDKPKRFLRKEEADEIIDRVSDLIDDPQYKPFFFKKLHQLGEERFLQIADAARDEGVEHKGRKFASLLKYKAWKL